MAYSTLKIAAGLALFVGLGASLGAAQRLSRPGLNVVFAGGPRASFVLECDDQPHVTSLMDEEKAPVHGSETQAAAQIVANVGSEQARGWLVEESALAVLREKSAGGHVLDVVAFFAGYSLGAKIASAWRGDCEEEVAAHGHDEVWWDAQRVVAAQAVCEQLARRTDVDQNLVNKVKLRITLDQRVKPCDARWLAALRGDEGTSVALTRLGCGEPGLPYLGGRPTPPRL